MYIVLHTHGCSIPAIDMGNNFPAQLGYTYCMHILITGGAGFIGSNFVHYWLQAHPTDHITVLDALTYAGNRENLTDIAEHITFIQGDICDPDTVRTALAGVDTVVHFAAESHVDRSIRDPGAFVRTNVVGTYTLLEAAKDCRIARFHHVSTDEVLGHLPLDNDERWTEQSPYNPRSPYAASKAASDHLVRAYHTTYGLPVTISNCANNYGPRLYPEKLLSLAITNLLEDTPVPIYGTGAQVREWLFVTDHCRGIEAILLHGRIGETYFIGPGEQRITNLELIRTVLRLMEKDESYIKFVADRPGHDQRYALSTHKIQSELGWQARVPLLEGLQQMIEWYRIHTAWWQRIKQGGYQTYYKQQYGNE